MKFYLVGDVGEILAEGSLKEILVVWVQRNREGIKSNYSVMMGEYEDLNILCGGSAANEFLHSVLNTVQLLGGKIPE